MEISISKTVQIKPYEPLVVTVTEKSEVKNNDDYHKLKDIVSACVEDIIATQIEKYGKPGL